MDGPLHATQYLTSLRYTLPPGDVFLHDVVGVVSQYFWAAIVANTVASGSPDGGMSVDVDAKLKSVILDALPSGMLCGETVYKVMEG